MSAMFDMKNPNDDYELREEYDLSQLPILPKGRYAPERRVGRNSGPCAAPEQNESHWKVENILKTD